MAVGVGPVSPAMAGPVISDVFVKGRQTVYLGMRSKPINLCMLAGEAISGYFKSKASALCTGGGTYTHPPCTLMQSFGHTFFHH